MTNTTFLEVEIAPSKVRDTIEEMIRYHQLIVNDKESRKEQLSDSFGVLNLLHNYYVLPHEERETLLLPDIRREVNAYLQVKATRKLFKNTATEPSLSECIWRVVAGYALFNSLDAAMADNHRGALGHLVVSFLSGLVALGGYYARTYPEVMEGRSESLHRFVAKEKDLADVLETYAPAIESSLKKMSGV
ncbi:hypothetical protein HY488_03250 [Candidatus Woesearchaeota archaeon]|nr:hypothetical protein [Candidatus Woesearchaeota archaeon]